MEKKYNFLKGYEGFLDGKLTINKTLKPEFENLLDDYKAKVNNFNQGKNEGEYKEAAFIGAGNPDAEILFIGKEMAIDIKEHKDQFDTTVSENINRWKTPDTKKLKSGAEEYWKTFSPWYPYYLQNNKICNKDKTNVGTSRTEYFYQRIISGIYEIPEKEQEFLTLHMYAFQSELSTATARVSAEVNPADRKQSIRNRKRLWKTPFFQGFPITILGIGPSRNYILPNSHQDDIINIEEDFQVACVKKDIKIGKKFINVHFSKDGKRMLLHTSHLSASSNELVTAIARICRFFLNNRAKVKNMEEVMSLMESQNIL